MVALGLCCVGCWGSDRPRGFWSGAQAPCTNTHIKGYLLPPEPVQAAHPRALDVAEADAPRPPEDERLREPHQRGLKRVVELVLFVGVG